MQFPERRSPVVGITANLRSQEHIRLHSSSEKYGLAVLEGASAVPLYIPGFGDRVDVETILGALDGLMLTGGASNIEPHHYGQTPAPGEDTRDPGRDSLVLPMIRRAVEIGMPVLGICRGIQEINVAFGGTLHQRLHEVDGREDHRRPRDKPWAEQLAPRQRLALVPGGMLAALNGAETAMVNSLHGQGIDRLAPGLAVEARADDGTIEAVTRPDSPGFLLGVQWHAEHEFWQHRLYCAIFEAFGDATGAYAKRRAKHRGPVEEPA